MFQARLLPRLLRGGTRPLILRHASNYNRGNQEHSLNSKRGPRDAPIAPKNYVHHGGNRGHSDAPNASNRRPSMHRDAPNAGSKWKPYEHSEGPSMPPDAPIAPVNDAPIGSFGQLASLADIRSSHTMSQTELIDSEAEERYEEKIADTTRPRPKDYLIRINDLIYKKNDLRSALDLFDGEMKSEYVKPFPEHYRVLIHACGKAGYDRKAFDLFKEYNVRTFRFNQGIIADLFNACANSPYPETALKNAGRLRENLSKRNYELSTVVYNNMIRAFGRCGDLGAAFALVDEMRTKKVPVDSYTYSSLIHGCISDKDAGFRHSLLVMRLMIEDEHVELNPNLYNLLLHATNDCGVGDKAMTSDVILACLSVGEAQKMGMELLESKQRAKMLQEGHGQVKDALQQEDAPVQDGVQVLTETEQKDALKPYFKDEDALMAPPSLPNLIEKKPNFRNVVDLGPLDTPQDRFLVIGGIKGFLNQMKAARVKPDIKTFSQMFNLIGDNEASEQALLDALDASGVKADSHFFNKLITRRARRQDKELGLATLHELSARAIEPDMFTFGSLAVCTTHIKDAEELITDIKGFGYKPNAIVYGALVSNFCTKGSPHCVKKIIVHMQRDRVKPSIKCLRNLEKFYQKFRDEILKLERGDDDENVRKIVKHEAENDYEGFRAFHVCYKEWLARTEMEMPRHPWKQFLTAREIQKAEDGNERLRRMIQNETREEVL